MSSVKIINAIPGTPSMINEEVEKFLEGNCFSKLELLMMKAILIFNLWGNG